LSKAQADLNFAVNKATVDASKAQVDVAVANLNKADQDVKRLKPLAEAQAVPQQDYDDALARQKAAIAQMDAAKANLSTTEVNQTSSVEQARAAVEAAKAAVAQAELNLGYCSITSPIDGLIGKREVAPGNLVGKGEPTLLATVSRLNPIRVMVAVSEAEYLKFARERAMKGASNRPLDLVLADGTPFPNKGHVVVADRAVDLKTGTLSLIAEFANPAGLIRPGQFGRVRAAVSMMENALLVPQKAVTEIQSAKIVYVVGSDNKVALRSVELGPRVDEFYVITEGVKAGERVVVEGIQKVRPGAAVQPTNQPVSKESAAK
nr:efflux RND transporter periplasmic adaptor subunit [Bryobacter sp.]